MKLRWTDQARRDLLAIGRYIALDNPHAARRWVDQLRERARLRATWQPVTAPRLARDQRRVYFLIYENYIRKHRSPRGPQPEELAPA